MEALEVATDAFLSTFQNKAAGRKGAILLAPAKQSVDLAVSKPTIGSERLPQLVVLVMVVCAIVFLLTLTWTPSASVHDRPAEAQQVPVPAIKGAGTDHRQQPPSVESAAISLEERHRIESAISNEWWTALQSPAVASRAKRVLKNDLRFFTSVDDTGTGSIDGDILLITACKAHMCPDEGGAIVIDLRDGRSAAAVYNESTLTVHRGDYGSASMLPKVLRDWLSDGAGSGREIRYVD